MNRIELMKKAKKPYQEGNITQGAEVASVFGTLGLAGFNI